MAWTERYVRADAAGGGDGTTNTNSGANGAWTLAEGITNEAAGMRLNVKAGTYANTTTSRTLAAVGTTTAPIWWRGFDTTPGDLDSDITTAKPLFTFTSGVFTVSGAHHIISNLSVLGTSATGPLFVISAANCHIDRIRSEHQNAGSNSLALNITSTQTRITRSWFKTTSTASRTVDAAGESVFDGCVFLGGGDGIRVSANCTIANCMCTGNGAHGINLSAASSRTLAIINCTIYGATTDGIRLGALPSCGLFLRNEITNCGGWGINNATGTNTNVVSRVGNVFYSNASGNETGFGDSPSIGEDTESSSPYTDAGSSDFSLVSGATAKGRGLPLGHENVAYTTYIDTGGVQRQESGGATQRSWGWAS